MPADDGRPIPGDAFDEVEPSWSEPRLMLLRVRVDRRSRASSQHRKLRPRRRAKDQSRRALVFCNARCFGSRGRHAAKSHRLSLKTTVFERGGAFFRDAARASMLESVERAAASAPAVVIRASTTAASGGRSRAASSEAGLRWRLLSSCVTPLIRSSSALESGWPGEMRSMSNAPSPVSSARSSRGAGPPSQTRRASASGRAGVHGPDSFSTAAAPSAVVTERQEDEKPVGRTPSTSSSHSAR